MQQDAQAVEARGEGVRVAGAVGIVQGFWRRLVVVVVLEAAWWGEGC